MTVRRRLAAVEACALQGVATPRRRRARQDGSPSPSRAPLDKEAKTQTPGNTTPARPCPICGKPPVAGYVPFCSKRCADVDLHKWLGGVYAIPAEEPANPNDPLASEETD